jgi:heme-degrading monooxygenase HmoA
MILEVVMLQVSEGQSPQFETAFGEAETILAGMTGYIRHELLRCVETDDRYVLLIRWRTLEDHTIGFRHSPGYQEWRRLLHHFYDPMPVAEHFETVSRGARE